MEHHQRDHIRNNLYELTKDTILNSLFVAVLKAKEAFGDFDTADLDSIGNRFDKTKRFYEIVVTRTNSYDALCDALKETKQTGALKILKGLKSDQYYRLHGKTRGIHFNVKLSAFLFTGRIEELNQLHRILSSNIHNNILATVVTGDVGIGKSELCRKYILTYSAEYYNNVIWLDGMDLEKGFKSVAKDNLKIKLRDVDRGEKDIKTVVDEVYQLFKNHKCLFVFDNVESSMMDDLDTFLPVRINSHNAPQILITSRDRNWELPFNTLILEGLIESDAVEFVKKDLRIEDNSQDDIIMELVTSLKCVPLMLSKASTFIRKQQTTRIFNTKAFLDGGYQSRFDKN